MPEAFSLKINVTSNFVAFSEYSGLAPSLEPCFVFYAKSPSLALQLLCCKVLPHALLLVEEDEEEGIARHLPVDIHCVEQAHPLLREEAGDLHFVQSLRNCRLCVEKNIF